MFCDITDIKVIAGNGGNGCMAFRREKFIPKGGPSGGDGGTGGNVVLRVNSHLNSLIHLHTRKLFQADKGEPGSGWKKNGAMAEDLVLEVPLGTTIKDKESEIICDLIENDQEYVKRMRMSSDYL